MNIFSFKQQIESEPWCSSDVSLLQHIIGFGISALLDLPPCSTDHTTVILLHPASQLGQILIEMQIVKVPCGLQTGLPVIDPATNPEAGIQIWLRCARTKHSLN